MTQPQPYPYYPPSTHSHEKYIAAVIIGVVVTAVVAGGIGYGLGIVGRPLGTSPLLQTQFTFTHGTVTMSSGQTAYEVLFDDTSNGGTLSSVVFSNGNFYQVYLPSGHTYGVTIRYAQSGTFTTSYNNCAARPSPITPSGSDFLMNFAC